MTKRVFFEMLLRLYITFLLRYICISRLNSTIRVKLSLLPPCMQICTFSGLFSRVAKHTADYDGLVDIYA